MPKFISPHVTIYKFPIAAISSIAIRLSGLYLSGLFTVGGVACYLNREDKIKNLYLTLDSKYQSVINYSVITPVTYHTLGGIRHLVWDKYPKLLNNKSVAMSSILLFGLTGISSYFIENKIPMDYSPHFIPINPTVTK